MTVYPIQATFSRGELSPALHGRVDIDHYSMGLARCENFYVLRQGGIRRRSGTVFVSEIKDSATPARLFPFHFNESQAYVIEHGDTYCRFYALDGPVHDGGSPYDIASPFSAGELASISHAQSADVLYMVHGSHAPQKLVRAGEVNWTFSDFRFEDGPYLDENTTATTLTPSHTGHITPDMSSNTHAEGTASTASGSSSAYLMFNRNKVGQFQLSFSSSGYIRFQFAGGVRKVADAYWISASENESQYHDHFTQWEFQGSNDGTNWVTLDSRDGETGWTGSETRYYEFENNAAYEYYQLKYSGGGGSDGDHTRSAELAIHHKASDQTPFELTASSTDGINDGAGFQSSDVGRHIRLLGADSYYRWAEITEVTSATVVKVRMHGHALPDLSPFVFWALGAWSAQSGWPETVGFYQERLALARNATLPRTIWLSKSLQFNNFGQSVPVEDSDGIAVTMTGGRLNAITFIQESNDLVIGTSGSMRTLGPAASSEALSSTNIQQKQQTTTGASAVFPVTVSNTVIYAGFHKSALHEFAYNFDANGYLSPELTVLSDHAFRQGISFMVYQEMPDSLIWCGRDDGVLVATTYDRDQKVVGVTRHIVSGGHGDDHGIVESACVVSVQTGDRLWMVVRRMINGETRRFVEYLEMPFENANVEDGVFFDSSRTVTFASPVTEVTGAEHLEGETVGVLADGVDIGDAMVGSGTITLPDGIAAEKITYGLRFSSVAQTLRLPQSGNRDGTAIGRRMRSVSVGLDLLETGHIRAGTPTRQFDYLFRSTSETLGSAKELFTGHKQLSAEDSWSNAGVAVLSTDRGYPATVRSVMLGVEGEP